MTINQQIEAAISLTANLPCVFSAQNVAVNADMEDLENDIEDVLKFQSTKKPARVLDVSGGDTISSPRYLGATFVLEWWIESTLRWAKTDVDCVTSVELARAMSAAFDSQVWDVIPLSLLDIGLEHFMVAEGCVPDTFVFPWASFLSCYPRFEVAFRKLFYPEQPYALLESSLANSTEDVLNTLRSREASVIQLRFGLKDGQRHTLDLIGHSFRVSRERIRQIESKALRKLRHPSRSSFFLHGLAADFMQSGGSLLIPESQMVPEHSLLHRIFGTNFTEITALGMNVITTGDLSKYLDYLADDISYQSNCNPQRIAEMLPFLSKSDLDRMCVAEEEYQSKRVSVGWTRPRMLLEALRSLGRAAHYEEIAEKCNDLFPDNQLTIRNWHAGLTQPSSEKLGIVWVGRKGMYGLKEHGYSRPSKDIFDSVVEIVNRTHSRTQQPVSEEVVIAELRKERRELNINSVKMALGFEDRLEAVSTGKYIPRISVTVKSVKTSGAKFDISAAFKAFSADEDDD